jgi:sugar phosphate isomerase/epimerase
MKTVPEESMSKNALPRRDCIKLGLGTVAALTVAAPFKSNAAATARIPLGLDAHSVRAMRWKAPQLLEYAIEQNADALLLNGPNYFESLDEAYLVKLRQTAHSKGIRMYSGAGSICKKSTGYSDKHGTPEQVLELGIRIAQTLGSPVVTCRIGSLKDRYTEGGIEARMEESIKALKALRSRAQDAGVKFAFENHAGDLRSEEVLTIINEVGPDLCGSMLDPGNALWAMEDPMEQIRMLGKHVLCTSVRDYMVWESEDGATFQWTAIGDGLMDVPTFTEQMAALCPGVPLFVESISNSPRPIPFLKKEFWEGYPNLRAADIVDFLNLCRRGQPIKLAEPPAGMDKKQFDQQHQKAELAKSFDYLRHHGSVGLKHHAHT